MATKKTHRRQAKASSGVVDQVLDGTHKVWLAGLGTVSWARAESVKVFEGLVREGEKAQDETRKALADSARQTRAGVAKTKSEAGRRFNRMERSIQRGVEGLLHRLGVPTARDVRELSERVSKLNDSMAELAPQK